MDAEPQQLPSKTRFVVECIAFPFVVAASVPLMWIGFLMLGGWRDGNPYRIFNDRILWDDEFNAKVPAMVMISILGFGVTLAEIVESRNDLKRSRRKEDLD